MLAPYESYAEALRDYQNKVNWHQTDDADTAVSQHGLNFLIQQVYARSCAMLIMQPSAKGSAM